MWQALEYDKDYNKAIELAKSYIEIYEKQYDREELLERFGPRYKKEIFADLDYHKANVVAIAYFIIGYSYKQLKQKEKAKEYFNVVIEYYPYIIEWD